MTMKNMLLFCLAVCALLFGSCGKLNPDGQGGTVPGEVQLSVRFDAPATKVSTQSVSNEKAIQNVQISFSGPGAAPMPGIWRSRLRPVLTAPLASPAARMTG